MRTWHALYALTVTAFATQLGCTPANAQPQPAQLGPVKAAIDYVKPHIPEGRIALHLDYTIGIGTPGTDEIRWVRPYTMIDPEIRGPVLAALGAVPFSRATFEWCGYGDGSGSTPCFASTVTITAPDLSGETARLMILLRTDRGDHERRFTFLINRSAGRWDITDVQDVDLWY